MSEPQIRPYTPADAEAFSAINRAWIEADFSLEPADAAMLADPQTHILNTGGTIMVGELAGEVVGVGAARPVPEQFVPGEIWWEVIKMGTLPKAKRRGIAAGILDRLIAAARASGVHAMCLQTNSILTPAITLYESRGFGPLPTDKGYPNSHCRCDTQMVLRLR